MFFCRNIWRNGFIGIFGVMIVLSGFTSARAYDEIDGRDFVIGLGEMLIQKMIEEDQKREKEEGAEEYENEQGEYDRDHDKEQPEEFREEEK